MRSVFEAVQPREDVLSGELRDEVFAAQLGEVAAGRGERVYADPDAFFANTFPTNGLKALLTQALGRIAGRSAAPIIRLETAFGGGKTHSLIALYHLAANRARPSGIEDYVEPALLPDRPVRVAAVVGNALDPSKGVIHQGATTFTLWGELAYQMGAYERLARSDTERIAPGVGSLAEVFDGAPVIVMLDEMARYLEVASGVVVGNSTLADQTVAFLMALLEYAASVDHVVVVYTLAGSADAFSGRTESVMEKIQTLKDTKAISSRHEHVISPTGENEISAIVRHRLFEHVDRRTGRETAYTYHRAIVEQLDRAMDLPAHAGRSGYARDFEDSYPFHPELLTGLNEKVSTIPNFQKTRGALRLLSRVVRHLWTTRPAGTFLIHPHHVDLSVEEVANDLTSRLDRAVFKQVIEADIVNPMAGAKAHAALVDESPAASGRPAFAARIATTVFLHSLVQGVASGLSPAQAKLAAYTPGDDLGLMKRQTDKLLDRAFYLHFDSHRYRFSTEPSLTAVINQEKQLIGRASAKQELDRRIRSMWKKGVFSPVFFPAEPSEIEDTPGAPRLAVIHYDAMSLSNTSDHTHTHTHTHLEHLFDHAGTVGGFRVYRNHLVFLCADSDGVEPAVDEARRYLAISRLVGDLQRFSQYTVENRKRLKSQKDKSELTLRVAITRLYRVLFYPDAAAPKKHAQLARTVLPAQRQGEVDRDQSQVVLRTLRDLGKALTADDPDIPPAYVLSKVWPANADRVTPRRLQREYATRIGLTILFDVNKLKETIKIGIRTDKWVYYDPRRECAYGSNSPTTPLVEITGEVELVRAEAAEGIPICGRPQPPPTADCPLCQNPTTRCTCGEPPPPSVDAIQSEGSPGEAFQRIVDSASERSITRLQSLTVRSEGDGPGFLHDFQALTLAVPQLPKSELTVEMSSTFDLGEEARLQVKFSGPWSRFREINNTIQRTAKTAVDSTGHVQIRLAFPVPVDPAGREMGSIRDTLNRLKAGRLVLTAVPEKKTV